MQFTPPNDSLIQEKFPQIARLELIDGGGFKAVYRAEIGGKTEAFKLIQLPTIPPHLQARAEEAEALRVEVSGRVRREIEVIRKCQCSEMVKLGSIELTTITINNLEHMAYSEEYLDGKNLRKLIQDRAPKPSEAELRTLFIALLKAVKEIWGYGYVHRDIKPANVMKLNDPLRPFVLLDLGIAFSILETSITFDPDERRPATLLYMAPEMLEPNFRASLDYRADLYTTAVTVFEYGAQQHPLARKGDNDMQTISRIMKQAPTPFRQMRPDLSPGLCALVDQMLKKRPSLRPANLDRLIARLEAQQ